MQRLHETLKKALLSAGEILRRGFYVQRKIHYKTPTSPVTQIDIAAEKKIVSIIHKQFPDHRFLTEESTTIRKKLAKGPSAFRWIIDPLDGTVNFIHGFPQSCVSIGVEANGQLLAGGIYEPYRRELFMAHKGKGATMNGKRIRVSKVAQLKRSLLITGFPYNRGLLVEELLARIRPFLQKGIDFRRMGSAALDLAYVACGRAEGFWEQNLNPWDIAAGKLIVEEAGGRVTNFDNHAVDINKPDQILATNGLIHREMVSIFSSRRGQVSVRLGERRLDPFGAS